MSSKQQIFSYSISNNLQLSIKYTYIELYICTHINLNGIGHLAKVNQYRFVFGQIIIKKILNILDINRT